MSEPTPQQDFRIRNLTKSFVIDGQEAHPVFQALDLSIEPGSFTAIVGESAASPWPCRPPASNITTAQFDATSDQGACESVVWRA